MSDASIWQVRTAPEFDRALRTLDPQAQRMILKALADLRTLEFPQARCKPLRGPLAGLWRRRVGDYRILVDIRANELVVVALDTGHRSDIYG